MKINKLKLYAIITTIILLLIVGYFGYNYFGNKIAETYYVNGYNKATVDIISGIQQTGDIPIFNNESGQVQIQQINIQEICGNAQTN